jgi:hypothetical protein
VKSIAFGSRSSRSNRNKIKGKNMNIMHEEHQAFTEFYRLHPELDCEANTSLLYQYLNGDEVTVQTLEEGASRLSLARQEKSQSRQSFEAFRREHRLSNCLANKQLYTISDDPSEFAPASQDELAEWRAEAVAQYNTSLLNSGPLELKGIAKVENEQRRADFQRAEIQGRITEQEKRDKAIGFDPIPSHNSEGQAIDRAFLLRLADSDIKRYRLFCTRYGSANITARLNGVR